jgi:PTS system N-acetylglucosamine-specific IIC component
MMKYLQGLGKSLLLPIATLPVAALLMGIGYWIDPAGMGGNNMVAAFLCTAGGAILNNIPILFAVGVAFGMTKKQDGAAAVAGLVAYLMVTTLLSSDSVSMFTGAEANPAFGKIQNAFIGMLSGMVAAAMFDRFWETELPDALAFFSGKRLVLIVTAVVMMGVSAILLVVWPILYSGLVAFGAGISSLGALGAGIFGFANRMLIPTGLHHALNAVFWFDAVDIADLTHFWAGEGTKGVTGMYEAGFFPVMMFGLPAAALAMYQTAKPQNKKAVGSLMLAGAVAAFFTGVTEPLEFSFMFLCPQLYLLHAVLTGISMFIAAAFHWTASFGFSAGLVDFILSSRLPLANQPYMLLLEGVVMAVVYYVSFRFLITRFNLKTPGREDDDAATEPAAGAAATEPAVAQPAPAQAKSGDYAQMAEQIYAALGGAQNVVSIDNCATRLRVEVRDSSAVDAAACKRAGAVAVVKPAKDAVQVVIGPKVQFVADAVKAIAK